MVTTTRTSAMGTGAMTETERAATVVTVAAEDPSVPATCRPRPSAPGAQGGTEGVLAPFSRHGGERAWPEVSTGRREGGGAAQRVWAAEKGTRVSPERGAGLLGTPTPHAGRSGKGEGRGAAAAPASGGLPQGGPCVGRSPLSRCAGPSANTAPSASPELRKWQGPGGRGPSPGANCSGRQGAPMPDAPLEFIQT